MSLVTYAPLISPFVDAFTLGITAVSAYYMYRQKTTAYQNVRSTLLAVYVSSCLLVLFEFVRINLSDKGLMTLYTDGSTSLVLLNAWLLTVAAIATYLRPSGPGYRRLFGEISKNAFHILLFAGFTLLVIFADIYLILFQPYQIRQISNLWGVTVFSTSFFPQYITILFAIMLMYLLYPTPLLVLAAKKVSNRAIRRSLIILAACWAAIALDLLVFDGYVWTVGIDANDVMYLVFASIFSITAVIFRNASTLAGFFEISKSTSANEEIAVEAKVGGKNSKLSSAVKTVTPYPFSKRAGMGNSFLKGNVFLMEVDPSSTYEESVKDFAMELLSANDIVFAFTSKGSPVYKALSQVTDVRFYLMSSDVSYPKPTGQPHEVLVPQHDHAVLLDLMNKTLGSTEGSGVGIIFDNVSDIILSSGFENCYKFLKQANQIISEPRVTALFLMTQDAHDEKVVRIIKSLFSSHLTNEIAGLKITRKA